MANRILFIDDEPEFVRPQVTALRDVGFEVIFEMDPDRAITLLRDQKFDLIILDPPKFAPTTAQVKRASRGYKDINLLAFKLLRPDGLLVTFSCSGHISPDLFQKIVFGASIDAGRQAQIIRWLAQPADHPVRLSFPEGRYLKGLVCRMRD